MRFLSPLLSILLAPLMACTPLLAQAPALGSPAGPSSDVAVASLQLRVAENDGGTAAVGSRSAKGLTVEVTDPAGAPVANAAVVFRLPDSGPSAKFADGTLAAVAYTDVQGRVQVKDIQWGGAPGTVALRITAVKDTMHAGLLLEENLTAMSPAPIVKEMPLRPRQIESVPQAVPVARVPAVAVDKRAVQPGQLPSRPPAANTFTAASADSPDANVPVRRMLGTEDGSGGEAPGISITTSGAGSGGGGGHSKLKWIVIAAVAAAGAGAALAFVHKGSSGGSTSSSSGVTIGSPSVSVGNP